MNTIQPGSFLTLHYRLIGPDGADLMSTFSGAPATLSLGQGLLPPALETRLIGLDEGACARFDCPPGEVFGDVHPDKFQRVKRGWVQQLSDEGKVYEVGDVVQFPTPNGQGSFAGVLKAQGDDWMDFDFNHPLAGRAVSFEVQIIGVL